MSSFRLQPGSIPGPANDLPPDVVANVKRDARINGAFAGLTSGLLGSNIASRLWKLSRNSSIFAGVLTAALSGYYFSEGFMAANLSRARAEVSAQKKQTEPVDSPS